MNCNKISQFTELGKIILTLVDQTVNINVQKNSAGYISHVSPTFTIKLFGFIGKAIKLVLNELIGQ